MRLWSRLESGENWSRRHNAPRLIDITMQLLGMLGLDIPDFGNSGSLPKSGDHADVGLLMRKSR